MFWGYYLCPVLSDDCPWLPKAGDVVEVEEFCKTWISGWHLTAKQEKNGYPR